MSNVQGRDSERLTWLDRDDVEVRCCTDSAGRPFVYILRRKDDHLIGQGPDIRAAIDDAMAFTTQGSK